MDHAGATRCFQALDQVPSEGVVVIQDKNIHPIYPAYQVDLHQDMVVQDQINEKAGIVGIVNAGIARCANEMCCAG
jgi:hypothetical protein